jgi:hypothetical protein
MYAPIKIGYFANTTQTDKGFLDYVFPNIDAYNADAIQYNNGRVDYLIGSTGFYSNIIVEQSTGWSVNWELINMPWETINNIWEQ